MKNKVASEGLWSIEQARNYLFDCAKSEYRKSRWSGRLAVVLVTYPAVVDFLCLIDVCDGICSFKSYCDGSSLSLVLSLFSIIAVIAHWAYFSEYESYQKRAKEIRNLELMYNVSNRRKVREIVQEYLPKIKHLKATYEFNENNYYSPPREINVYREASYKILENCIWNTHLYGEVYRENRNKLARYGMLIGVVYLIAIWASGEVIPSNTPAKLAYIVGLIGSSSLVFNFLDTMLSARSSQLSYHRLEKEIQSGEIDSGDKFFHVYNIYSHINLNAPDIDETIYNKSKDSLNESWNTIQRSLPQTDTLDALRRVLPIIKHIFANNSIKWAITGSTSHYLKHQPRYCRDIDIILSDPKDAVKVNRILNPFVIEKICFWESADIRSYYGKFNISGVNIEVISEVENLTPSGWVPHPRWDICSAKFSGSHYPVTTAQFDQEVHNIMLMKKGLNN